MLFAAPGVDVVAGPFAVGDDMCSIRSLSDTKQTNGMVIDKWYTKWSLVFAFSLPIPIPIPSHNLSGQLLKLEDW